MVYILKRIEQRFRECGLTIHPDKSGIIYCKDADRKREFDRISFDFLGYEFRPRKCVNKKGMIYPNFAPAISKSAKKAIIQEIRSWHIQIKTDKSIKELSGMFDSKLRGWYNYYGKFYSSAMWKIWNHFNKYLVTWVRRKYKRFSCHTTKAWNYLSHLARGNPNLFIHWKLGLKVAG